MLQKYTIKARHHTLIAQESTYIPPIVHSLSPFLYLFFNGIIPLYTAILSLRNSGCIGRGKKSVNYSNYGQAFSATFDLMVCENFKSGNKSIILFFFSTYRNNHLFSNHSR